LCYNSTNNRAYCAGWPSYGADSVTVIDGAKDSVIKTLAAGYSINDLCYDALRNKIYCAAGTRSASDSVTVIDGASDSVIAAVSPGLGDGAGILCLNSREDKVYCSGIYRGIAVIDAANDSVVASLPTGLLPAALCYNSLNNKLYCANSGDVGMFDSTVTVIDGASDSVVKTIVVGVQPSALAWNPVQNRVYVANYASSSISVLRDSMSGVEEGPKPQAPSRKLAATVMRTLPAGAVAFDAMGRRVANPRSGVYFLRSASSVTRNASSVTKVVIQH
jgi:YVTN family beta-propeller protein